MIWMGAGGSMSMSWGIGRRRLLLGLIVAVALVPSSPRSSPAMGPSGQVQWRTCSSHGPDGRPLVSPCRGALARWSRSEIRCYVRLFLRGGDGEGATFISDLEDGVAAASSTPGGESGRREAASRVADTEADSLERASEIFVSDILDGWRDGAGGNTSGVLGSVGEEGASGEGA